MRMKRTSRSDQSAANNPLGASTTPPIARWMAGPRKWGCIVQNWISARALGVAIMLACLLPFGARAQDDASSSKWQFYFTPYLWVSGITGTTSTHNPNVPAQSSSLSFGDILSHLNAVPVMGATELRYDRFGLLVDLMVVSMATNVATKDIAFNGGNAKVTELISTVLPTYRVLDTPDQFLDLGFGARVVALWTTLTFNPGLLPGFSRSASVAWATPLLGVRCHANLNDRWGVTAYGDVGGVDADSRTWQLLGTVDYRYNAWLVLHAGYRHLHINYSGNALESSTALSGPMLGSTIRF
jgi:hypothetical protein